MRFALLALILGCATSVLPAQPVAFEAATVRINRSGSGATAFPGVRTGMLSGANATLHQYLRAAYDLPESRIAGPDWIDVERYDITGKPPAGASVSAIPQMLKTLLEERFRLTTHQEMREMPVFDMVIAKGGLKMAISTPEKPFPKPPANAGGAMNMGAGTMAEIAQRLGGSAGRPIIDKTGIEGKYGFLLIFARPDQSALDGPPDFFAAVEQQLGLKLVPTKASIEVLVIDKAERIPGDN